MLFQRVSSLAAPRRLVRRGILALALLTAATAAVGARASGAGAQFATAVNPGGPYTAVAGQSVTLTGTTSVTPLSAAWTFSDGVQLAGLSVTRTFGAVGTYSATLTVMDSFGVSYAASTSVTVTAATYSSGYGYAYTYIYPNTSGSTYVYPATVSPLWPYAVTYPYAVTVPAAPVCPGDLVQIPGIPGCSQPGRGFEVAPGN